MEITPRSKALAYAIFMVVGSYFKKAVPVSDIKEKRLRLYYSEQKRDNQIKMEEQCIKYFENFINDELTEDMLNDMVEVKFIDMSNRDSIKVIFKGFDWRLSINGIYTGNKLRFEYEIIKNN